MIRQDLKPGDEICFGEGANRITVRMVQKSGRICSLQIEAPQHVKVTKPTQSQCKQEDKGAEQLV